MEAAQGLQELGEGIVYIEVRGVPAPTSHPRAAAQPVMDQLPRRIDGMHPRVAREEAICKVGLLVTLCILLLPKCQKDWFQLIMQQVRCVYSRKVLSFARRRSTN